MYKLIYVLAIVFAFATFGCGSDEGSSDTTSSDDVAVATVSSGDELLNEDVNIGDKALYPDIAEKDSKGIERSFENAPPLIPHTVKGSMKITRRDNECLNCHLPEKAKKEEATPMPKSHFTEYRPAIVKKGDLYVVDAKENELINVSKNGKIDNARYFCNQSHVPQVDAKLMVKNTFKADFRSSKDKKESNLNDNIGEGVK